MLSFGQFAIALVGSCKKRGKNWSEYPYNWQVFTDSREALKTIRKLFSPTGSPYLRDLIYQSTLDLSNNGHFR